MSRQKIQIYKNILSLTHLRKMKIKTTLGNQFFPIRLANTEKIDETLYWRMLKRAHSSAMGLGYMADGIVMSTVPREGNLALQNCTCIFL
jgi:hypothetical protein